MSRPAFFDEHICEVCSLWVHEHDDDERWNPRCCYGCPCGVTKPKEE